MASLTIFGSWETKFYYKAYKGFCVAVQDRDDYFLDTSCSTLANKM